MELLEIVKIMAVFLVLTILIAPLIIIRLRYENTKEDELKEHIKALEKYIIKLEEQIKKIKGE